MYSALLQKSVQQQREGCGALQVHCVAAAGHLGGRRFESCDCVLPHYPLLAGIPKAAAAGSCCRRNRRNGAAVCTICPAAPAIGGRRHAVRQRHKLDVTGAGNEERPRLQARQRIPQRLLPPGACMLQDLPEARQAPCGMAGITPGIN